MKLRIIWAVGAGAALLGLVVAGVLATATYIRTMGRLEDYAALSDRVSELRRQNERLSDLETELQELLLFQDRILNLAGVESVLRRSGSASDNRDGLFGPDSTDGAGMLVVWPVTGKRTRPPGETQAGVDIVAVPGQTVMAAGAGEVVAIEAEESSGFRLHIAHGDSLATIYANLGEILVSVGDHVLPGQAVARVASGPKGDEGHLHFEVVAGGKSVPPEDFVRRLRRP